MLAWPSTLLSLALVAGVSAVRNSIYVIHEVESPGLGLDGLTPIGVERAQNCIPNVFRTKGIGKIITCTPDLVSGACYTALASVQPLADDLGLEVDTSCGSDEDADDDCVANLIDTFAATSTKAILVIWAASAEDNLYENLDIELPESDDDDGGSILHHDEYVTIRNGVFISFSSQDCPNIDGQAPGTGIYAKHAPPSSPDANDAPISDSEPGPSPTFDEAPVETTPAVTKRSLRGAIVQRRQRRSVSRLAL
jgi:hypothetical protein